MVLYPNYMWWQEVEKDWPDAGIKSLGLQVPPQTNRNWFKLPLLSFIAEIINFSSSLEERSQIFCRFHKLLLVFLCTHNHLIYLFHEFPSLADYLANYTNCGYSWKIASNHLPICIPIEQYILVCLIQIFRFNLLKYSNMQIFAQYCVELILLMLKYLKRQIYLAIPNFVPFIQCCY